MIITRNARLCSYSNKNKAWGFLMNVMAKFGFNEKFINLVHQCISTVNFTLLINRSLVLKKISHQGNSYNRIIII